MREMQQRRRKTLKGNNKEEDVQLIMNQFIKLVIIALSLCQDHRMLANRWVIHQVVSLSSSQLTLIYAAIKVYCSHYVSHWMFQIERVTVAWLLAPMAGNR